MRRRQHLSDDREGVRRWGVAAAAALALGAGVLAGRASVHPATDISPASGLAAAPSVAFSPPVPRVVAGVPQGYPHSTEGARDAAVAFIRVEFSDLMAHPDAYRAAWREMCTPAYYEAAGERASETVLSEQEAANHLASNAAQGQVVFERAVPVTAAVAAAGPDVATVRTWSLILEHPGDGPTVVSFQGGVVQLRWWNGDWRLDGGGGSSSSVDGTTGALRLDDGPAVPGYLTQPEVGDAAAR